MSRITKFSQIPAQLNYTPQLKSTLSPIHSEIITAVLDKHELTSRELKQVIQLINTLSYRSISDEELKWDKSAPLDSSNNLPDIEIRDVLVKHNMYVAFNDINWEIDGIVKVVASSIVPSEPVMSVEPDAIPTPAPTSSSVSATKPKSKLFVVPTPKEDLYLKSPTVPRFSTTSIYASVVYDDTQHVIYSSLPSIPTKQNEISITTDVSQMTSKDILRLYPNHIIKTRFAGLYQPMSKLEMLDELGAILPISHFTREQVLDNIIKYPHLHRLMKIVNNQVVSFYTTIEIDGELKRTADVWNMLPESDIIPYNSDYIKEYVIRRYLLERDIDHVEHQYPMLGTLDPFLTLFMPIDDYIRYGYSDVEDIGRRCVKARVSYKQSRNPILRRLKDA